jgi:hypothetical protein
MKDQTFDLKFALDTVQAKYPHLRIGQIISNAVYPMDVFYIGDEEIAVKIWDFLYKLNKDNPRDP